VPTCLLGAWWPAFVGVSDISSRSVRMRLLLVAEMVGVDTVPVEVGHSHLRRVVTARVQTNKTQSFDLSTQWVAERCREGCREEQPRTAAEEGGSGARVEPEPRQRPRSGGTWRAYVREMRSNDLKTVAENYRRDKDQASPLMLRCRELGAFANERARVGFSRGTSFGPRHAVAERASARRLAQARARALSGGDDSHSRAAETLLHEAALVQMPSDDVVKLARLLDRECSSMERTREAEDRAALAQFHEENKARVHSDVEAVLPAHGQGAMELMAVPSSFGLSLVEARQSWVSKGAARVYQHMLGLMRSRCNSGRCA